MVTCAPKCMFTGRTKIFYSQHFCTKEYAYKRNHREQHQRLTRVLRSWSCDFESDVVSAGLQKINRIRQRSSFQTGCIYGQNSVTNVQSSSSENKNKEDRKVTTSRNYHCSPVRVRFLFTPLFNFLCSLPV